MDQIKELLSSCKTKADQVNLCRKYEESERHWYCRKEVNKFFLIKSEILVMVWNFCPKQL